MSMEAIRQNYQSIGEGRQQHELSAESEAESRPIMATVTSESQKE
jgi:hypothetical protein